MFSYFSKETRVLHVTSLMFFRVLPTLSIIISLHVCMTWQKIRHCPYIIITNVSSLLAHIIPIFPLANVSSVQNNMHMCFHIAFVHIISHPIPVLSPISSSLYSFLFYNSSLNIYCLMQLFLL
jgi:hypothetical protein